MIVKSIEGRRALDIADTFLIVLRTYDLKVLTVRLTEAESADFQVAVALRELANMLEKKV